MLPEQILFSALNGLSHPPNFPAPKEQLQWNPELPPRNASNAESCDEVAMVISIKQRKVAGEIPGRWCRRGKELTV